MTITTSQVWPVNENNELVFSQGTGSSNITGYLPESNIPIDEATNTIPYVLNNPTKTVTPASTSTYVVAEGMALVVIGQSLGTSATIVRSSDNGTYKVTDTNVLTIPAKKGAQTYTITVASGSVQANAQDYNTILLSQVTSISQTAKFFYPWVRDGSNNVINKGPNAGDAIKTATSATAQTGGYFTSVAGTYGSSGTGRYYVAPASNSNFDPTNETVILNIGFNKATPASNENFCGTQTNSSTSGFQFQAQSGGNVLVNYKPGNVQNAFTGVSGLLDSTNHNITIVIDRNTKNGYLYVDSVLRQTKTDINYTGTASALQTFVFGGYSAGGAYDAKFFNCHLYAIQKDAADINIQACVDKIVIQGQALTAADLGG